MEVYQVFSSSLQVLGSAVCTHFHTCIKQMQHWTIRQHLFNCSVLTHTVQCSRNSDTGTDQRKMSWLNLPQFWADQTGGLLKQAFKTIAMFLRQRKGRCLWTLDENKRTPFHVFWLRGQGVVDILKTKILSQNRKKWANFGDHSRTLVINALVIFSRNRVKNWERTPSKIDQREVPTRFKDICQSDLNIKTQTTDFHLHKKRAGMTLGREEWQIKKQLDKQWKEVWWQRSCRKSPRGRKCGYLKSDSSEKGQLLERGGVRRPF